MNFTALCDQVAERTGQKRGTVRNILEQSFDVISETLLVEPSVGVGRFGRFRLQQRGEGMPPRIVVASKASNSTDNESAADEADTTVMATPEAPQQPEQPPQQPSAGSFGVAFQPPKEV